MQVTSTESFYKSITDNMKNTISTMQTIDKQISSLELYENLEDLDNHGKLETVLALKDTLSQTTSYIDTNIIAKQKMELQDIQMGNIIEMIQDLKYSLILNQSAGYLDMPTDIIAQNTLAHIGQCLNVEYSGTYLFSGSKTATRPLGDLTDINQINNYYGNEEPLYLQTTDSLQIQYNHLNANKPEFRNLFKAIHEIKNAYQNKDIDKIMNLQDSIDQSLNWLIKERTRLQENTNIVADTIVNQTKSQLFLNESLTDLTRVTESKFTELTSKYFQLKFSLEAQFKLISILQTLSLSSYL